MKNSNKQIIEAEINEEKAISQQTDIQKEIAVLQYKVDLEVEKRKVLTKFIADHMKRGTDYGPIHMKKDCPNKYNCENKYHFSKDCLFKPGAEKFVSLMNLKSLYKKDTDTWEMSGNVPGLFCYICELVDQKGKVVGEGRGSSSIQEKGSANQAIKIAEKRAKMDAVLSTGGLSDFFTQDLEDMGDAKNETPSPIVEDQENIKKDILSPAPIAEQQKTTLMQLLPKTGKSIADMPKLVLFVTKNRKDSYKDMTYKEAQALIAALERQVAKKSEKKESPLAEAAKEEKIDLDEVEEGIKNMQLVN